MAVGSKVTHGAGDAGGGGGGAQRAGGGGVESRSRGVIIVSRLTPGAGTVTGSHPYQAAAHNGGGYSGVRLRPWPVPVQCVIAACVVTGGALRGVVMPGAVTRRR